MVFIKEAHNEKAERIRIRMVDTDHPGVRGSSEGREMIVAGTVQGNAEQTDWSKWSQPKTTVTDVRLDSGLTVQVSPCGYRPGDRLELIYAGGWFIVAGKLLF